MTASKRLVLARTISILSVLAAARMTAAQPAATQPFGPSLREAAGGRLLIGTAIMSNHLDQPRLAELIASQFNCITGENEFKPASLEPRPGEFNFAPADRIADFARDHDMKVVGHTLLWHNQTPAWMFQAADGKPLPREQALANLRTHIEAVVSHFKGRVIGWDVVNETLPDGDGDLRQTPAFRAIGDDYIEKAFEFAHAADPNAELYYNDYSIENPPKREKAIKLIRRLKEKGVRIDAIGIQGHWMLGGPSVQVIDEAIAAFKAEGVKVMITELDVDPLPRRTGGADITAREQNAANPYPNELPDDVQQRLARRYAEIFEAFERHRGDVTRVTLWGTHDGTSWLNGWPVRGRTNHPLLWDRQLRPKPALNAVVDVLRRP